MKGDGLVTRLDATRRMTLKEKPWGGGGEVKVGRGKKYPSINSAKYKCKDDVHRDNYNGGPLK